MQTVLHGCELHLHILGAYHAEDVLALGRDHYNDVDWNASSYLDDYQRAYGQRPPEPIQIFIDALSVNPAGFERLKQLHVYGEADAGDFNRWEIKQKFFTSLWSHYRNMGTNGDTALLKIMLDRHKQEGLDYVEYRLGSGMGGFLYWHSLCAEVLQKASNSSFRAGYILSFPRDVNLALECFELTQELFNKFPKLIPTIVGVDFASVEEGKPPKDLKPFCEKVKTFNAMNPKRALDIVYHVGESYFDKSLESAIRWCHEVADMGAKRIGHAIALGLDPDIALLRRSEAHEYELVSERLDQIAYDLIHQVALSNYGVSIDKTLLKAEMEQLKHQPSNDKLRRPYTQQRIDEVRYRQAFVLNHLTTLGTVIECCPTSNLRIGGVPEVTHHPIHRFLKSNVNLVICSDDPGNFDVTLASEINWVVENSRLSEKALVERLGDPRRFRLGQKREERK